MSTHHKIVRWLVVVAAILSIPSAVASGASSSYTVYHVWCGDCDPNPVNARQLGESTMVFPDHAVGQIIWGSYGGAVYVWERLTNAPVDERIAMSWLDYQNHGWYQCGDSHAYSTATMWAGASATWTAGVPLTPPRPGDSQADCVGFLVWRPNGSVDYQTPAGNCLAPWITSQAPPAPAPPPRPLAGPAPASAPRPGVRPKPIRVRMSLHGSRSSLRNGHVLWLRGRVLGLPDPAGVLIELQAWVGSPRRWLTFGVALVRANGRFVYRYRFTQTTGVQIYSLRAKLPMQKGYPARAAISRALHVRVTGA
jgi:hypothetical protein